MARTWREQTLNKKLYTANSGIKHLSIKYLIIRHSIEKYEWILITVIKNLLLKLNMLILKLDW